MCGALIDATERKCGSCGETLVAAHEISEFRTVGDSADAQHLEPAISIRGTMVPRYLAAALDNALAMLLAFAAAAAVPENLPVIGAGLLVVVYLLYHLVSEGLIAATPGKLLTGLAVARFDGGICTWRQILIRTLFRIVEVNPLVLGGLPAAMRIALSKHRQRFGDSMAGTIVVPRRRLAKYRSG